MAFVFVQGAALVAAISWVDVTSLHDNGRGLQEQAQLPDDALVHRVASKTVFIYSLEDGLDEGQVKIDEELELPLCTGGTDKFRLADSGVLPRELQDKFSTLRSYIGLASSGLSADIVVSPVGFRVQIWMPDGIRCYIDPHTKGRSDLHTIYANHDVAPGQKPRSTGFLRRLDDEMPDQGSASQTRRLADASLSVKKLLPAEGWAETYTYRLIVACSYEYIMFANSNGFGGAMALLATTLTRVSGLWGREIGMRFTLHPNNNVVCSEDPSSKIPTVNLGALPNNNPGAWMKQGGWPGQPKSNIEWLTDKGFDINSYDIAHYFSIGDAGGLGGQTVCDPSSKANGGTAGKSPSGDSFDVEYVAHEMGHQFGTSHTWSGSKGSCTPDQFMAPSAVELGSGSTLETYANICDTDDIATSSQPYFHLWSLAEFQAWYKTGDGPFSGQAQGCGNFTMSTTNHRPTAMAPVTCSVPRITPFILTGNGTDADGDTLNFNWEQLDSSPERFSLMAENKKGPLFISVAPSTTGNSRSFPKFATVLDNAGTTNIAVTERLSSEQRTLHMAMTVRDKYDPSTGASAAGIFGTWHAAFTNVGVAAFGPLNISEPNATTSLNTGFVMVKWNVAGPTGTPSTDPDDVAVLGARYEVAYSVCGGSGSSSSTSGCGQSWNVVAPSEKVTGQGMGSSLVFLPSSARGKVVFRVKANSSFGCEFYTVTPMLTAALGTVSVPKMTDTQPLIDATDAPLATPKITLSFSGPVFVQSSDAVFTVTPMGGAATSFSGAQIQIKGANLDIPLGALNASTQYTVHLNTAKLCATPTWPCSNEQQVSLADWNFTTASSELLRNSDASPRQLLQHFPNGSPIIAFGAPIYMYPFGTDVVVTGDGGITVTDSMGQTYCMLDVVDPNAVTLNISSNTAVIDFTDCALWAGSNYSVSIDADSFEYLNAKPIPQILFNITTTRDLVPPILESIDPPNGTSGLPEYEDISLVFSKYIKVANSSASILLKSLTAGSPDVVIPLTDCCDETNQVLIYADAGEIIITPTTQLTSRSKYSLVIPPGALADFSMNSFAGISPGQYVITTGDTSPPGLGNVVYTVAGSSVSSQVCFDANATIALGRGNFGLVNPDTNGTVASIGVKSGRVTINGNCVSIDFSGEALPVAVADASSPDSRRLLPAPAARFALQFDGGVLVDDMGNGVGQLKNLAFPVVVNATVITRITGSLSISVPNASLFVNNPNNALLVARSISTALAVPASWVTVVLSVSSRRMLDVARRLQGAVLVSYTISVPVNAPVALSAATQLTKIASLQSNATLYQSLQMAIATSTGTNVTLSGVSAPSVGGTTTLGSFGGSGAGNRSATLGSAIRIAGQCTSLMWWAALTCSLLSSPLPVV